MTNPIQIGLNIANPMQPALTPDKNGAPNAADFAILLEGALQQGTKGAAIGLGATAATTTAPLETIDLDALSEGLGEILALLSNLKKGIDEELPLDNEALDMLPGLLETVSGLLESGAIIDPDSPLLSQLRDISKSLGLDAGGQGNDPEAVLESLSALAARMAKELRDTAPELAAGLNELARRLDVQIAAIEQAAANAQPDAGMRLKLVESETKPNVAAALAQNAADKSVNPEKNSAGTPAGQANAASDADANPDLPRPGQHSITGDSGRTLAGAEGQNATKPNANGTQPNAQVTASATAAAAAASLAADADADLPDGLTHIANQTSSTTAASGTVRPETAAYARPEPRINMPHIAVEIARSIQNGLSRFEIRLNPPELGRIDVRLEMDQSGNVTARLAVEKSETLDLLQRDQRALEKALSDAGIDSDKTDLEFSLRQDSDNNGQPDDRQTWKASIAVEDNSVPEPSSLAPPGGAMRGYARLDAVNLWV